MQEVTTLLFLLKVSAHASYLDVARLNFCFRVSYLSLEVRRLFVLFMILIFHLVKLLFEQLSFVFLVGKLLIVFNFCFMVAVF
jgi:hypothetical protein